MRMARAAKGKNLLSHKTPGKDGGQVYRLKIFR